MKKHQYEVEVYLGKDLNNELEQLCSIVGLKKSQFLRVVMQDPMFVGMLHGLVETAMEVKINEYKK